MFVSKSGPSNRGMAVANTGFFYWRCISFGNLIKAKDLEKIYANELI